MKPPRALSLLDLTCIGVNAIVGSSIFLFPGRLAEFMGPASVLAFALTGLLLLSVGLCFAEASTHYDRPGGPYLYATECFGSATGFGIGWMCWVTMIVSWAAVANAVAVYLGHFGPAFTTRFAVKATAALVIVTMGAINYRGVKLGAWTSNFFTAAKLIPLAVFVLAGLPHLDPARFTPFAPHGWAPLGKACFLAYFAFQGFETVPVPAGEVAQPQKNVPLAVFFALALSSLLYMLVQAVAVGVHPGLAGAERPLAASAALILGPTGAAFIVAGAAVSMVGYNAGSALGGPRYLVALAQDRHFPAWLAAVHPRYQTPFRCIALTTGLTLAAAIAVDFDRLVDFSNVVICAQFISTCVAVPLLRRRHPAVPGRFRLPGTWLLPLIGVAATVWLGMQGGTEQIWWSIGALVLGFLLRAGLR